MPAAPLDVEATPCQEGLFCAFTVLFVAIFAADPLDGCCDARNLSCSARDALICSLAGHRGAVMQQRCKHGRKCLSAIAMAHKPIAMTQTAQAAMNCCQHIAALRCDGPAPLPSPQWLMTPGLCPKAMPNACIRLWPRLSTSATIRPCLAGAR